LKAGSVFETLPNYLTGRKERAGKVFGQGENNYDIKEA